MNFYLKSFAIFLKIGLFTIGGGYAMVPLIQDEIVEKRKWIDKEDFPTEWSCRRRRAPERQE